MLLQNIAVLALLSVLARPSRADVDEVIDLQDLLRNVSSTLKDLKNVMASCESAISSVSSSKPRDCADLWKSGTRTSGVHRVWPDKWQNVGSFEVYCDMETDGGGWTVIQRRGDYGNPQDYFYKNWAEYRNGFGQLEKEFWLGNERIFALTNQDSYHLRVNLWDLEGNAVHAKYNAFWLENEDQQYRLKLHGYSGNAGDSLSAFSGVPFSTKDRKNDLVVEGDSCAAQYKGAWWYTKCHSSNLNGLNLRGPHESYADGIEWNAFKGYHYSLPRTEMKIRSTDFQKSTE